ncbi:MAG: hypothetical protein UGE22_01985 [Clostridia bacterium]|nr:hypothetical protein [Clostridia bacterium]
MQMKNKVKSEKGIMTMYVTIAVVTFTIILVALFSLAVATRRNQIKTLIKVKEVYEQDNNKKEQIYLAKKEQIERQLPRTKDTVPYYPDDTFEKDPDTNLNDGLVIRDSNGNEYVWIEVPKSLYANSSYNTKTTTADQKPTSSTDYDKIEYCLHKYTDYYRRDKNGTLTSFKDTYYSDAATGLTSEQYYAIKQKMLKSVYENGGFWIGRYEAGITTNRTASGTPAVAPLSKAGTVENPIYPYTYVTCSQAQTVANMLTTDDYTGSLMFGVQWDLVLKHIEVKEVAKGTALATIQNALRSNSTSWGNYSMSSFKIDRGKYAKFSSEGGTWKNFDTALANCVTYANGISTKIGSNSFSNGILLTTGASDACKKMNIYDLAGNTWEWTLEYAYSSLPCTYRGGSYGAPSGGTKNVSGRSQGSTTAMSDYGNIGFRVTLYK